MRCRKCGMENSDALAFCAQCGTALPEREEVVPESARPKTVAGRSRWLIPILAVVVVSVAVSSASVMYYSPDYSWSSSIRDHDGDGVPDGSDPSPYDPGIWAYGQGSFNLTIRNNHSSSVQFDVDVDEWVIEEPGSGYILGWTTEISGNDTHQHTFNLSWFMGQNSTGIVVVVWGTEVEAHSGLLLELGPLVIADGQNLALSTIYPDDFSLP